MTINMVIVGVGGQGTLLASKILGVLGMKNGYDVRVSEVHGMSQRGGSVTTYVRLSNTEKLYSTIVEQEQADVVLAFEQLEAVRALPYLKKDGVIIANSQQILPVPVIIGNEKYPDNCIERIKAHNDPVIVDAAQIAIECGTVKAVNTVLLGVLATRMPFEKSDWLEAIADNVKPAFKELNEKAFIRGYELSSK